MFAGGCGLKISSKYEEKISHFLLPEMEMWVFQVIGGNIVDPGLKNRFVAFQVFLLSGFGIPQ